MREKRKDTIVKTENVKQSMETEDKFFAVLFLLDRHTEYAAAKKLLAARNMQKHGKDKGGSPMRKIKYVFALLAALLALTSAALAAEPGDALVPVGEAVAISLRCDGVVVSALADIASEGGACCPAGEAGVQAGDKIVAVNGERVTGAEDFLRRAAAFSGEGVTLSVERGGETKTFVVTPKLGSGGTYQIGLWLRDAVRGLGTVTFYDPATGEYGALGHGVGLPETGELMSASGGEIYRADVTGVVMGERGTPGELCGGASSASPIGSIEENTVRGIFGTSRTPLGTLPAMPVAAESEIRLGEATILSTVSTGGVRSYDAVITRIARSGDGGKLTLTITDGDLLAVTGGIVQGMSGSPILQNGKIVGAVTHVLVNDPTKGYGISMENMLEAAS